MCGKEMIHGFAYLSGGALLHSDENHDSDSIQTDRLGGFLHIGFHGKDAEMMDSFGVSIVDDLHGGQFDIHWCSIDCMRMWFLKQFRIIESTLNDRI